MDFVTVILFLILYYIRPHEWIGWMSSLRPVTIIMAAALGSLLYKKIMESKLRPSEFLRTPQDWAILAFTIWILYAAADAGDTWDKYYNRLAFYVIVAHALSDIKRLERFMWWWLSLILVVAFLAVAGEYGWDPLGSYAITHGRMEGRVVVNLSIFRNPNSLGHSIVPAIPMIYYLMIWKRFLLVRPILLFSYLLPGWCLYLTQSKGSFLSGGITMLGSFVIGRPKVVQMVIIAAAYSVGMSVLLLLPRMHSMENPKSDPGVQGRLFAWELGLNSMKENKHGLGYDQFRRTAQGAINAQAAEIRETRSEKFTKALEKWREGRLLVIQDAILSQVLAEKRTELHDAFVELALKEHREEIQAAAMLGWQQEKLLRKQLEKEAEREVTHVIHDVKLRLRQQPMDSKFRRQLQDDFGPALATSVMTVVQERTEKQLTREIEEVQEKENTRVQKYLRERNVTAAPHCSYVEVGAELGRTGLFLWLSILYFCMKSLILVKTGNDQEERIRRLLFGVILASLVSAWMTNLAYRGTFFVQAGAVAAFHNYMKRRNSGDSPDDGEDTSGDEADSSAVELNSGERDTSDGAALTIRPVLLWDWTRSGEGFSFLRLAWFMVDMLLIYVFYRLVIYYWLHFLYDNISFG